MNTEDKQFPKMTRKQACDTDTIYFTTNKVCPECGDNRRWRANKNKYFIYCYTCFPDGDILFPRDINKQEKDYNAAKQKLMKSNWSIPVVFGGYNTNK